MTTNTRCIAAILCWTAACVLPLEAVHSSDAVDVCIAIGRSEQSTPEEWKSLLNYVSELAGRLWQHNGRLGLVSFDSASILDIPLNKHSDLNSLQHEILIQPYGAQGRDLSLGLYRIREECFTPEQGDRLYVGNAAVLVTDGSSDWHWASLEAETLRKEKDAPILSIGVGPAINNSQLVNISGGASNVFLVNNYHELELNPGLGLHTILSLGPTTTTTNYETTSTTQREGITSTTTHKEGTTSTTQKQGTTRRTSTTPTFEKDSGIDDMTLIILVIMPVCIVALTAIIITWCILRSRSKIEIEKVALTAISA